MKSFVKIISIAMTLALSLPAFSQGDESRREIKQIKGDLYNIQDDNNTFTAFLVTPDGIILTDPINQVTAKWISAELGKKFDVPVKYVVYSHHHDDHAPGAEFFEGATIIAHENAVAALDRHPGNPDAQTVVVHACD